MLNQHAILHQQIGDVFKPGKLDPAYHAPLVNELTRFATEAGIAPRDVSGADYHLTDDEKSYLKGFRQHAANGCAGIVYVGHHNPPVQSRMRSSCGALLRNYLSARLMFRDELVHELWDKKRHPNFDFVAVPDLAVAGLAEAPKRAVGTWLLRRMSRGEQTAVGVGSKKAMLDLLGPDASALLENFRLIEGVTQNAA